MGKEKAFGGTKAEDMSQRGGGALAVTRRP
jgi:hypothetical protein